MQKITYLQAADLLGVKYATIKNAVLHKKLTRCTSRTSEAMLLKEQVELFKNKRISEKALNLEEKAMWDQYKEIAENPELLEKSGYISMKKEELNDQIVRNAYDEGGQAMLNSIIVSVAEQIRKRSGIETENPLQPLSLILG